MVPGSDVGRGAAEPRNLLEMVPLRVHEWRESESGTVQVLVPRYGSSRVGRWVAETIGRPYIVVKLDSIGSVIWRSCDGVATAGEIAEKLGERFGDEAAPVIDRLASFLQHMDRGKLIRWRD